MKLIFFGCFSGSYKFEKITSFCDFGDSLEKTTSRRWLEVDFFRDFYFAKESLSLKFEFEELELLYLCMSQTAISLIEEVEVCSLLDFW